jgi:hypothetical protein
VNVDGEHDGPGGAADTLHRQRQVAGLVLGRVLDGEDVGVVEEGGDGGIEVEGAAGLATALGIAADALVVELLDGYETAQGALLSLPHAADAPFADEAKTGERAEAGLGGRIGGSSCGPGSIAPEQAVMASNSQA